MGFCGCLPARCAGRRRGSVLSSTARLRDNGFRRPNPGMPHPQAGVWDGPGWASVATIPIS
eukprot:5791551-Pleurochrysis_carterae.AAC.1